MYYQAKLYVNVVSVYFSWCVHVEPSLSPISSTRWFTISLPTPWCKYPTFDLNICAGFFFSFRHFRKSTWDFFIRLRLNDLQKRFYLAISDCNALLTRSCNQYMCIIWIFSNIFITCTWVVTINSFISSTMTTVKFKTVWMNTEVSEL